MPLDARLIEAFLRLPADERLKQLSTPLPRDPVIELLDRAGGSLGFVIPTLKPSRKLTEFQLDSEPISTKV